MAEKVRSVEGVIEQDRGKPGRYDEYQKREAVNVDAKNVRKESCTGKEAIRSEQGDSIGSNCGFMVIGDCSSGQRANILW